MITCLCLISCTSNLSSQTLETGWKLLDLNVFKISVPKNWNYIKEQGDDSFIGLIKTNSATFSFNYSSHGYANSLLPTAQQYINSEEWMYEAGCVFCKVGVTYTAKWDVQKVKAQQMKEKGITDSTLVKVEAIIEPSKKVYKPTQSQHTKYPAADYIAELTYKDSTIILPIKLPKEIAVHNIVIDTSGNYIVKTIWPKTVGKGMTGVYISQPKTHFTFQLSANNLSEKDQTDALKAFKTIKFKE